MKHDIEYDIEGRVRGFYLLGFGTGTYTCKCVDCGKPFIGDKRAIQCLECVIKIVEKKLLSSKMLLLRVQEYMDTNDKEINHLKVLISEQLRTK